MSRVIRAAADIQLETRTRELERRRRRAQMAARHALDDDTRRHPRKDLTPLIEQLRSKLAS